jgi:hypothetical protein
MFRINLKRNSLIHGLPSAIPFIYSLQNLNAKPGIPVTLIQTDLKEGKR